MFCDSHYISRFAAFFIDARAKRSFVESFDSDHIQTHTQVGIWATLGGAEARDGFHGFGVEGLMAVR
jgi:hypothetical protein